MTTMAPARPGCCKITAKTETTLPDGVLVAQTGLVTSLDIDLADVASTTYVTQNVVNEIAEFGVQSAGSSTDNAIARWDGTDGHHIQDSGVFIDDDNLIYGYGGKINLQTGTIYTLQPSDAGKILLLRNTDLITLYCPQGLGEGFVCTVIQNSSGQIRFFGWSGGIVVNRQNHIYSAGANAAVALINIGGDTFVLCGDTIDYEIV